MKNFFFPLTVAFIISLLIHFLFFNSLNKTLHKDKLNINTSKKKIQGKKGFTSIKYVKLQKPKTNTHFQKTISKPIPKVIKKKKIIKKNPLIKKVKTIKIPNIVQKPNLRNLFTLTKKEQEEKQQNIQKIEQEQKEIQRLDKQTQQYIKLYGDQYFSYSDIQKKYIKQNINTIGKITQKYLRYPPISARTGQQGINIVEFILHPNGDITNLRITDGSGYTMLDKNSIQTIELAYKDYPKPKEPTKIKIYVKYILY